MDNFIEETVLDVFKYIDTLNEILSSPEYRIEKFEGGPMTKDRLYKATNADKGVIITTEGIRVYLKYSRNTAALAKLMGYILGANND